MPPQGLHGGSKIPKFTFEQANSEAIGKTDMLSLSLARNYISLV